MSHLLLRYTSCRSRFAPLLPSSSSDLEESLTSRFFTVPAGEGTFSSAAFRASFVSGRGVVSTGDKGCCGQSLRATADLAKPRARAVLFVIEVASLFTSNKRVLLGPLHAGMEGRSGNVCGLGAIGVGRLGRNTVAASSGAPWLRKVTFQDGFVFWNGIYRATTTFYTNTWGRAFIG